MKTDSKVQLSAWGKKILDRRVTIRAIVFVTMLAFCLSPLVSPPLALLLGILVAQFIGHPFLHLNHKATHILLQISVVGLGFGMNMATAWQAGTNGLLFTVASILGTLLLGYVLGKMLKIEKATSYLISAGSAICGGSAIAALAPVIKAGEKQISVALGTIFILNSFALFVFPLIGHALHLSQLQFGLWSAIAIQDTSSVVGAANKYGGEALQIGTTVKLTRALWIIPIALLSAIAFKSTDAKIKIPYFIGFFVVAMVLNTYVPFMKGLAVHLVHISKIGLTVTLFLIGSGLSGNVLAAVGYKPLLQGVLLWLLLAAGTLWAVSSFL